MGKTVQGVIHCNPGLAHQVHHANAFANCGFYPTDDISVDADVHVISGPHYAFQQWKHHPRVLMIDRAWWGDPDCVSIGWLQPDGTRRFATGEAPRPKPEMAEWKSREASCLILADYGQDVSEIAHKAKERFVTVDIRLHPADDTNRHIVTLETALRLHDVAIGHAGTSLFEAIRMGLPAICTDKQNECLPVCAHGVDDDLYRGPRDQWMHDMSYTQFSLSEIADGTAWNLLKDIQ